MIRLPDNSAPSLARDGGGAAYVEFLLAFVPLFIMFLGMVQMALMYAGDLVVQHAATTAARAAAVVIDDDPRRYGGAERMTVSSPGITSAEDAIGTIVGIFGGGGGGGSSGFGASPDGPRMDAIRRAASIPLMAVSPSMQQLIDSDSIHTAIGSPESRAATGIAVYNSSAMAVTFPETPGGSSYRTSFSEGDQVVTRVTYLFHCGVPVVNRMMCENYASLRLGPAAGAAADLVRDLAAGDISFDEMMDRLGRIDQSRRRHERDNPAIDELEAAASDDLMYLTVATGARFKVLRGEAAMPLQYARYLYPGE